MFFRWMVKKCIRLGKLKIITLRILSQADASDGQLFWVYWPGPCAHHKLPGGQPVPAQKAPTNSIMRTWTTVQLSMLLQPSLPPTWDLFPVFSKHWNHFVFITGSWYSTVWLNILNQSVIKLEQLKLSYMVWVHKSMVRTVVNIN